MKLPERWTSLSKRERYLILAAVTVALAVSLFAGLVPAVRARRLTVVEALREEI